MNMLNKKWKEFLYGFAGFGPNFLMVLMGAYFTDAINPAALEADSYQAIASQVCFIVPVLFPALYAIAKAFDGIIDIPFAHITDTLSTRWGRRRPAIVVCMIPMMLSFAMCWWPIGGANHPGINTAWIIAWSLIFFSTYTMCLIAYYGSLSQVCNSEGQRLRVSSFKSFFDTISYCLVYALVPLLLQLMKMRINIFVYCCLPLMLTIAIPLFMIKEGKKYGYPERKGQSPEKISIWKSIKLTFGNKMFLVWLLINSCTFFGLQMFLVGMNAMIGGGMGFNGAEMAIVNTFAFAPVPVMLYLFNKLKAKKGVRFTYQTCLASFALAIMSFFFASTFICGDNKILQYVISISGSLLGSWAIGAFFMMPYLAPAQISAVEEKLTGKNHSAMYFAANAVVSSIVGAISSSLVYENIKMLFIQKSTGKIVWAEDLVEAGNKIGLTIAEGTSFLDAGVFNLGTLIVPFVVCAVCIAGVIIAMKMPRDYSPTLVAKELKRQNPGLDISMITDDKVLPKEKGETLFVNLGLAVLSGFIFDFIWVPVMFRAMKEFWNKNAWVPALVSCIVPFAGIYFIVKANKALEEKGKEMGVTVKAHTVIHILSGIVFMMTPFNLISLTMTQHNINKLYHAQSDATGLEAETVQADEVTPEAAAANE